MATHRCSDCTYMYSFWDNSDRQISFCTFDLSSNYLQKVGYCTEDCELEGFAEEVWRVKHFMEEDKND